MDWWHNSIISVEHSFSTTMMPFPIKRHAMTMSFVHQVCVVPNSNQPYGLNFEWPGWNPELNLDPWKGCIWFLILFFQGGGVKVWLGVMLWRIFKFIKKPTGISISDPEISPVFFRGDFLSEREFPDVGWFRWTDSGPWVWDTSKNSFAVPQVSADHAGNENL